MQYYNPARDINKALEPVTRSSRGKPASFSESHRIERDRT